MNIITPNVNPSNASPNNTIYHAYSGNKITNIVTITISEIKNTIIIIKYYST